MHHDNTTGLGSKDEFPKNGGAGRKPRYAKPYEEQRFTKAHECELADSETTSDEKVLLLVIRVRSDWTTGVCTDTNDELRAASGLSLRTTERSLAGLAAKGILQIDRKGPRRCIRVVDRASYGLTRRAQAKSARVAGNPANRAVDPANRAGNPAKLAVSNFDGSNVTPGGDKGLMRTVTPPSGSYQDPSHDRLHRGTDEEGSISAKPEEGPDAREGSGVKAPEGPHPVGVPDEVLTKVGAALGDDGVAVVDRIRRDPAEVVEARGERWGFLVAAAETTAAAIKYGQGIGKPIRKAYPYLVKVLRDPDLAEVKAAAPKPGPILDYGTAARRITAWTKGKLDAVAKRGKLVDDGDLQEILREFPEVGRKLGLTRMQVDGHCVDVQAAFFDWQRQNPEQSAPHKPVKSWPEIRAEMATNRPEPVKTAI